MISSWLAEHGGRRASNPVTCSGSQCLTIVLFHLRIVSTGSKKHHGESDEARDDAADDIPGGVVGEAPSERIAELVGHGMGGVHTGDEEEDADDEQSETE